MKHYPVPTLLAFLLGLSSPFALADGPSVTAQVGMTSHNLTTHCSSQMDTFDPSNLQGMYYAFVDQDRPSRVTADGVVVLDLLVEVDACGLDTGNIGNSTNGGYRIVPIHPIPGTSAQIISKALGTPQTFDQALDADGYSTHVSFPMKIAQILAPEDLVKYQQGQDVQAQLLLHLQVPNGGDSFGYYNITISVHPGSSVLAIH